MANGMAQIVSRNTMNPNGCVINDETNSSLAAYAKLVVRPQLGHGIPVR